MVTIYNTSLSTTSERHFSDGQGGGQFEKYKRVEELRIQSGIENEKV